MTEKTASGESRRLSEVLFNRKAYQVIAYLLDNPDKEFSISDIKEGVDVSRPVISDVLNSLKDIGLVDKRKKGNLYLVSVNRDSTYYGPLEEILQLDSRPLEKAASKLIQGLKERELLGEVVSVYLFGSVARGVPRTDSDIDLLFIHDDISEEDKRSVQSFATSKEKRLRVQFSITWYGRAKLENDRISEVAFVRRVEKEGKHLYGEKLW